MLTIRPAVNRLCKNQYMTSITYRYASNSTQQHDSDISPSVASHTESSDKHDETNVPDTLRHNTGVVSGLPDGFIRRKVQIYKPCKTSMSSYGDSNTTKWTFKFDTTNKWINPLMGWISSRDTATQVKISFDTVDEAIAFAEKQGFEYTVHQPHERQMKKKSYSDNFR